MKKRVLGLSTKAIQKPGNRLTVLSYLRVSQVSKFQTQLQILHSMAVKRKNIIE